MKYVILCFIGIKIDKLEEIKNGFIFDLNNL